MNYFCKAVSVFSSAWVLLLISGFGAASAQDEPVGALAPDLETAVNAVIEPMMKTNQAVGMTLSIVKDGEVLLAKGYGESEPGEDIRADHHLFRIASITKTFTATAIMQLIERGAINLDDPVSNYIDEFSFPEKFSRQITIRDLLAHRGGLEEVMNFIYAADPDSYRPIAQWTPLSQPSRVRQPGSTTTYANWGYSILGLVVENVSGMPWEDYMEANIFAPLGMSSTTAKQPLTRGDPGGMPENLRARLAKIYLIDGDGHKPWRYELLLASPGGAISSTATDMARYMLAHLNDGRLGDATILSAASARLMREPLFPNRRADQYGFGFILQKIGQHDTIRHDGGIGNSKSTMVMVPSLGIGVFSSQTGAKRADVQYTAVVEIIKMLAGGVVETTSEPYPLSLQKASSYEGDYLTTRRNLTSAQKILLLTREPTRITAMSENGSVVLRSSADDEAVFEPVGEDLFQNSKTGELVEFFSGEDDRPALLQRGGGYSAFERVKFSDDRRFFFAAFLVALGFSIFRLFTGALAAFSKNSKKKKALDLLSVMSAASAVLTVAAAGLMALVFSTADKLGRDAWGAWPLPWLPELLTVSSLHVIAAGLMTVVFLRAVFDRTASASVFQALMTLSMASLAAAFVVWNMFGYEYY